MTDIPNADLKSGIISIVKETSDGTIRVISKSAGTVDYVHGEINLGTVNITSTSKMNDIIEIQAFPESNDIVGLKDLYLSFNVSDSEINMVRDVIASGDEISGTVFTRDYYTSSYSNGNLIRRNMIQTGFEPRVKVQEIIANQLPSFIGNPKTVDFQKYIFKVSGDTSDLAI